MYHQSANQMTAAVSNEIQSLKAADASELAALPSSKEKALSIDARKTMMITWHDRLPSGEHRIVVQASQRRLFGLFGQVCADGFALSEDGTIRDLTETEITSFT